MPYLAPGNDTKDNNKKWPTNNSSDSSAHDDKNTPTSTIHSSSISILYSSLQSRVKMSSSYDISGSDNVLGRRQQHKYETLSPLSSISPRRKSAPDVLKLPLPPKKTFNQQDDDQLVTIRKKSGEIVKSSLKKRSKSEPSTPLIPKYVHFNADLEQIRLFKEAREPQAVSADVSSDESDDDDDDDDFFFSDNDDDDLIDQEPLLTISIPNMPPITTLHSSKPVFVESIYLSKDKRRLEGRIMVQNIAFRKLVEVRYTFDFWQTVSEVKANYAEGVIDKDDDRRSFDVFVFSIELFDNSRNPIDGKIMYFAVHYNVCNRDYWDNNSGSNYQVNFKKIKNSSSSSSQCNHHCYHKYYQYNNNNNNNNDNHKANRVSSSSSSNNNNNNNNNSSSRWPIISSTPVSNRQKSLNNDCHSPPAPASSTTHTSITDPRKRAIGRYDIGTSLSAAQNIASFSSTNNNNNKGATTTTNKAINNNNNNSPVTTIMTTSPFTLTNNNAQTHANYYYHISKLTISCDPYGSFGAGNYIDGMPVTTETPLSSSLQWDDSPKGAFGGFPLISSNPIEIPSRKSSPINSTNNYYDHIISQYCFSSGSPYAISPSPFASSPTIHL